MRRPIVAVLVAALLLAAATAGGLIIAACGGSSDTSTTQAAASGPPGGGQMPDMSALFTKALDPLVEQGTITNDQEDAVVASLKSAGPGSGGMGQGGQPPGSGAQPSPGATPMGGGQQAGSAPDASQMFSSALGALVDNGTITAKQESAISDALSTAMQKAGPGQQGTTQTGSSGSSGTAQTY